MANIEYKGVEYELVFNLNVMEEIQEEYGTIENWSAKAIEGDEPNIKMLKFGFKAMLNEGIEIYNEDNEEQMELLTDKQVGRIISSAGFEAIAEKISDTVVDSVKDPNTKTTKKESPKQ